MKAEIIPFHTPGHKLGSGVFSSLKETFGDTLFRLDSSDEVMDFERNNSFELVLSEAEKLAAELFGANDTLFLVNGTTSGIHSMLKPLQGKIIVPRFSHVSVYTGLTFAAVEPIFMPTEFDLTWMIPKPPTVEEFNRLILAKNLSTNENKKETISTILTYPTYYGQIPNLKQISNLTIFNNGLILVDEAHGGHFHFSKLLPESAIALGADFVAQSTHKYLGSLTQTSMLHCNNKDWTPAVRKTLQHIQTTSPSLIFLAILDETRRQLAIHGNSLVEKAIELAESARARLENIPGVEVLHREAQHDPTKLVISMKKVGLRGFELEDLLRKQYGIQVEMSDYFSIVALITIGDSEQSIDRLLFAIKDIANKYRTQNEVCLDILTYPEISPGVMTLREAFYAETELVALTECQNRVSAGYLIPYPPGVPLVIPGEIITSDVIEWLHVAIKYGCEIRGFSEGKIGVIKDI